MILVILKKYVNIFSPGVQQMQNWRDFYLKYKTELNRKEADFFGECVLK